MRILCSIVLFLIAGGWAYQSQSVLLYNEKTEDGLIVHGRNENFYPVTVEVNLNIENLEPERKGSLIDVISAKKDKELIRLKVKDIYKEYGVSYRYSYYMGSIFARHDESYAYRLPYRKGSSHRLDQGYGGSFSHYGEITYALDFKMEEGTPVYAARNGLVVATEDRFDQGGPTRDFMPYTNSITILHEDGTFADYAHLKKGGVIVKPGQRVRAGQHIGYSGSTGFTTGPHLHFAVKRAVRGGHYITLPVKFRTVKGIVDELEEGKSYISY